MNSPTHQPRRTFKGFVAFERRGGPMIWGTLRPTRAEAEAVFRKWNPTQDPIIIPVRLSTEPEKLTSEALLCE